MCQSLKKILSKFLEKHLARAENQSYFGKFNRIINKTAQRIRTCEFEDFLDIELALNFLKNFYLVLRGQKKKNTHSKIRKFFQANFGRFEKRRNLIGVMLLALKINL